MTEPEARAERVQELTDRLAAGETVDRLLSAGEDRELLSLAALALQLGETLPVRPSSAFRAQLQAQLQAELVASRRQDRRLGWAAWFSGWLPRLAAVSLAVVLMSGTAVVASAASLPGEPLYGVKRAAENVRLLLSWAPEARVAVQLDIAAARLAEIAALRELGRPADESLAAAVAAAHEAARAAAMAAGDPALLQTVQSRIVRDDGRLPVPTPIAPDPSDADEGSDSARLPAPPATATLAQPSAAAPATEVPPATATPLPRATATLPVAPPAGPSPAPPTSAPPAATEPDPGGVGGGPLPTNAPVVTDVPPPTSELVNNRATQRASYTPPSPRRNPDRPPPPTRRPRGEPWQPPSPTDERPPAIRLDPGPSPTTPAGPTGAP